jgi:hypothetical protein
VLCDVCNAATTLEAGVLVPAEHFRLLLSKGWGVHESNVGMLMESGVTRDQAVLTLATNYASLQSPWLLCPECATEAGNIAVK